MPRRAVPVVAPRLPDGLEDLDGLSIESDASLIDLLCSDATAEPGEPIEDLVITRTRFVNAQLTGAMLKAPRLEDVVFESCELSAATFEQAYLERVVFLRCRMSAFAAPELRATDVRFVDCRLDEAWLRMSTLERCSFEGCTMAGTDLYGATVSHTRFQHCELDGAELSAATLDDVALHGSSIERIKGSAALRNVVLASDQLVAFAIAAFPGMGVSIEDEYLDDPDP